MLMISFYQFPNESKSTATKSQSSRFEQDPKGFGSKGKKNDGKPAGADLPFLNKKNLRKYGLDEDYNDENASISSTDTYANVCFTTLSS